MLIHNYSAQLIVSSACPVGLVLKKTIANCSNSSFDKEKNFLFHTGTLKNLKVEKMAKELSFQLVDKKYIEVVPLRMPEKNIDHYYAYLFTQWDWMSQSSSCDMLLFRLKKVEITFLCTR